MFEEADSDSEGFGLICDLARGKRRLNIRCDKHRQSADPKVASQNNGESRRNTFVYSADFLCILIKFSSSIR